MISPPRNVMFQSESKGEYEPLTARIISERLSSFICRAILMKSSGLYYINAYGSEIHPSPNPDYITSLSLNDVLVYSCGSLWTRYSYLCVGICV